MKNFLVFTSFLFMSINGFSQTPTPAFEFQLYFEDAVGNKDTLIIGDAPAATNLIDTVFGEENIINQPWNSVFEVRVSNKYWEGYPFADTALMQAKKAIVNKEEVGNNYITFDIKTKNWPVTISWDSTLFHGQNDSLQYAGTWMTAWEYGQWWDGGMQPVYLGHRNEMLISNDWHDLTGIDYEGTLNYYYQNNNDTIYTMWFNFQDSSAFTLSVKNSDRLDEVLIYPNPFTRFFILPENLHASNIQVRDINGRKIKLTQVDNKIYPIDCVQGLYFLTFEVEDEFYSLKLIKR